MPIKSPKVEIGKARSKYTMFFIDETICSGCGECQDNCPVGAIEPTDDGLFKIDASVCSDCAACQSACPFEAVQEDPE